MSTLYFKDANIARDEITTRQKREIRKLYNQWAREIRSMSNSMPKRDIGDIEKQRQLARLYYQLRQGSRNISSELDKTVRQNVSNIADITVRVNNRWLNSLGFTNGSLDLKFNPVKDTVVRNIITGNIYNQGYSLSDRIWNLEQSTMRDIYTVVAKGLAENKSMYEIAKDLEKYVNPNARLPWHVYGKTPIHNRVVDYNAQRLAKTLTQHAYQQAIIGCTKDNPLVKGYLWHAAGGHPCQLCQDRDGNVYSAETIPLDHPNGECTIEPIIDGNKNIIDLISNAYLNPGILSFISDLDLDGTVNPT